MKKSLLFLFAFSVVQITFGLPLPGPAGLIGGPVTICKPANGIVFSTDSISHATGYVWTLPAGAIIIWGMNKNRIKVSFDNSAVSGNITVYGTNSSGNGSASTLAITVSPYPVIPTITPPGPLYICPGSGVNISVTPQSGSTYCWYSTNPSQMKSWQYLGIPGFSAGHVDFVSSKFSPTGQLYVAFEDSMHSYKASVMKFDGSNWQYVGSPGFSVGSVTYTRIAFSPSGQLYIGYKDAGIGCRCTVKKFDGANWVYVGSPILSVNGEYPAIAINPSGLPFLGYKDYDNSQNGSVEGCMGTGWSYLGLPGFTPTGAAHENLVIDSAGYAYFAFQEIIPNYRASVMRYNGTNWAYVGTPAFSDGSAVMEDLVFSPTGQLHIVYSESYGGYSKPTVKKFNGSNWVGVGLPRFSLSHGSYPTLAFDPFGVPSVAYEDYGYSTKATVMKLNGIVWEPIGLPGFTAGDARWTSLNFSPSGDPYVAYVDYGNNVKSSVMHYSLACLGDSSVYTVNTPGTYTMTISNQVGCTVTSSNQVTVLIGSSVIPTIYGPAQLCFDTSGVTYSTESGMSGYSWTVSSGGIINSGAGTNIIVVNWGSAGAQTVSVNYYSMPGCLSQLSVKNVYINSLPIPTISGITNLCVASGFYNYITEAGMSNYSWNISPGGIITWGSATNQIQVTWNSPGNQWVSVNYMNTAGCTGANSTILNIEVDAMPGPAGNITGAQVVCAGDKNLVYSTEIISNANTYIWTFPPGINVVSGFGTNVVTVNVGIAAISGNINVYGNNLCGNGPSSPEFVLTVNPIIPAPVITNTGNTLFSNTPQGNQWYFQGTLISGATSQIYVAIQEGYYWDVVTVNGCSSDTSNHKLIIITSVDNHSAYAINVIPVPNKGQFDILITTDSEETFSITIYNSLGVKIYEKTNVVVNGSLKKEIDLRPLPGGIYNVIFENKLNQIVKRIIVNN